MCEHHKHMREAIRMSEAYLGQDAQGSGPFGCVIVKDGEIIGRGANRVTLDSDPTAHAEVVAIRDAAARLGTFDLTGCVLYASCAPCPMCLSAIMWARIGEYYYANRCEDAADAGFDDSKFYAELAKPEDEREIKAVKLDLEGSGKAFAEWKASIDKIAY